MPGAGERGRSPERARSGTPSKMTLSPLRGAQPEAAEEAEVGVFEVGQHVEVEKFPKTWYVGVVRKVDGQKLFVHYEGWSEKWDDWVNSSTVHLLAQDAEGETRLKQQQRTRSPSPGPRRGGKGDRLGRPTDPAASPVRNLSQMINLGEIKGRAPDVFTESIDKGCTAVVVMNQVGDPTIGHASTTAADQVLAVDQGVTVLTAARQAHLHVIHVTFGCYTNDGSDLEFFKQRTIGDEHSKLKKRIVPAEYSPAPGEAVLLTSTTSAFASTGLEQILKNMHVVYLIFIGSYTDGCLGLTAADSISRGFLPTVIGDASLGSCRVSHLAMLRMFDQHWGRVKSAEGQVAEIEEAKTSDQESVTPTFPRKARLAPAHMSPRAQRAEHRHATNAATMLQTAWRGKRERINRRQQAESATKIQARYRGNRARANLPIPDSDGDDEVDDPAAAIPSAPLPPALRGRLGAGAVPETSAEEENVRELLLQAITQPGGRMRISPYSTETTFSLTKRTTGGFGLGMMESTVTGMMTVNRIAPGGVAEAAGIKEGFVLVKLGGHDLLQGAKSLQAAQQAIQPLLPGPIDWVFAHPSEEQLVLLDHDGDGQVDEAELLEAMLDGTAGDADIDVSKAGFARQPPPLPTQSSMTPTPKPAATSSATPWQKLTYLDENDANRRVKSLAEAQQLVNEGVLGPETLVWRKGMDEWEHLEDIIEEIDGLVLVSQ